MFTCHWYLLKLFFEKMSSRTDMSTAHHLLEHIQNHVEYCEDIKHKININCDLQALISFLEDPLFRNIIAIEDSLCELNSQLGNHPSILPSDFNVNLSGLIELSIPTTIQSIEQTMFQDLYNDAEFDQRVPVVPVRNSNMEKNAQFSSRSVHSEGIGMPAVATLPYTEEFKTLLETTANGREICTVQLYKTEGISLGFSVVGLRCKDRGELGIFLQEIQSSGIAGSDGRLIEGDQILAIDGKPLDSNVSHEQAISILQKARGFVELIVARSSQGKGPSLQIDELPVTTECNLQTGNANLNSPFIDKSDSRISRSDSTSTSLLKKSQCTTIAYPIISSSDPAILFEEPTEETSPISYIQSGSEMVLNTDWAQVEVINLINDGSGLGFGIVGGRSTGVVVKTILPGGVADRDNHLQSGDHILQIGDINLRGMGSEQVAAVLRQSGTHVRLIVARPVEPTSPDYQVLDSHAPIVPTKILGDPEELERHLIQTVNDIQLENNVKANIGEIYLREYVFETDPKTSLITEAVKKPLSISSLPTDTHLAVQSFPFFDCATTSNDAVNIQSLPELERFTVELQKDSCGLGITIAGYVCEKEELSGIFVKSISDGSAADLCNQIQVNDRIVEVNNHSLQGYSNHEAVDVLRNTGLIVKLCLERYLRGPKYEQLQQAIAASESKHPQICSPSIISLPTFPMSTDAESTTEIETEVESQTTVDSTIIHDFERHFVDTTDDAPSNDLLLHEPIMDLTLQTNEIIKINWQKIIGTDVDIVIAQLTKFTENSGLGISLEGTVDVENGREVRPHHYIRSILPEGPVGQNGILRSGDELLEVNGHRLLGINHMEVVSILKKLPINVRMVCGRNISSQDPLCPINTAQHQAAFQTRSILGGSLQNLLPVMDRLVKAKSDGSLASTTNSTDTSLNKMKSRSLEPLTGLAMWSCEPQIIKLVKGERGLGFSILDYQDPMNLSETVIVIRSLVPGGVAQMDGRLIPGDRLLFVNDIALENATLDQAVQALKGAPKGAVRIGVAKPLPIPDSIAQGYQ